MAETFHRFNDRVYLACIWLSGISIVVMSVIIPWGIFTRYVLGTGSQWPEPIAIQLMVLFTFLGAAVSYRAGAHIAVAMIQLPWLRVGITYLPVPLGGLVTALFVLEVIFFGSQHKRAIVTFDHLIEDVGAA